MSVCTFDQNCPGALVCYNNVSWSDVSLCACSFYYGGTGADCAELTTHSYIMIAIDSLLVAICGVLLLFALLTDVRVGFIRHKLFHNDDASLTWVAAVLGLFFFCGSGSATIGSFLRPDENTFLRGSADDAEKEAVTGTVERVFLNLGVFFAVGAALNISLMWIDVATRTKKMMRAENSFRKYRNGVRGLQFLWFIISTTTLIIPGLSFVGLIGGAVLVLIIGVTYILGRKQFVSLLAESMGSKGVSNSKSSGIGKPDPYLVLIRMIKRTSTLVVIGCFIVFGLIAATVPIALDWKNYGLPGGVGAYAIMLHALYLVLVIFISTIYFYTHNMLNTRINSEKAKSEGGMSPLSSKTDNSRSGSKGQLLSVSQSI